MFASARARYRRAAARDIVLITIALALLGAAAWLYLRGAAAGEIPDTAESAVAFVCRACGKDFKLTGRELHEATINYDPRAAAASGDGPPLFPCKHCGKRAGERAPEPADEAREAP